jgi:hypothetical protein
MMYNQEEEKEQRSEVKESPKIEELKKSYSDV